MGDFFEVSFSRIEPDRRYAVEQSQEFTDWWEAWGNADLHKLYRKFGINLFRRSTALLGLDRFCRVQNFRGKRCIEIGTCKGLTAIILARHFGEVVTMDIFPDDDKRFFAEVCGLDNITFYDIADNTAKADIINQLDFDAAYIDGNHAEDTEIDFNLTRRCGRVLFHEYWPLQPPVWGLVNNLRQTGTVVTHGDSFALWTEHRGQTD